MSKAIKGKRIALRLEFYSRGKGKKPAVSFIGLGDGVPMTAYKDEEQAAIFSKFSEAAHEFCKQLIDADELG